ASLPKLDGRKIIQKPSQGKILWEPFLYRKSSEILCWLFTMLWLVHVETIRNIVTTLLGCLLAAFSCALCWSKIVFIF
ncbi:unnamed protein product, partial [Callosobruchus maculatus]